MSSGRQRTSGSELCPLGRLRDRRGSHLGTDNVLRNDRGSNPVRDARPEIRNGLAYAAKLHGVLVHAACLMSTHSHEVITDVRGEYPKFLQTFHRYLALWN
jgi:putative transposase